jgi:hypothetical protein
MEASPRQLSSTDLNWFRAYEDLLVRRHSATAAATPRCRTQARVSVATSTFAAALA